MAFSDDIGATPGTGATFRALVDAVTGVLWPPELAAYASIVSAGANQLQVVTPDFPLPVTSNPRAGGRRCRRCRRNRSP